MSRAVLFICLLMLVSAAVSFDFPGGLKLPGEIPKTDQLPKIPDLKSPDTKSLPNLGDSKM